jgi:hypothetical protein
VPVHIEPFVGSVAGHVTQRQVPPPMPKPPQSQLVSP